MPIFIPLDKTFNIFQPKLKQEFVKGARYVI